MREWVLELPFTKPPLNLNQRLHWAQERKLKQECKDAVIWLVRGQKIPHLDHITVQLHYQPTTRRRRDVDNLMATHKPCVDGLVAAGVVDDDTPEYVTTEAPVIDDVASKPRVYLRVIDG